MQYVKPTVFLLALLPLARLIWLGSAQDLGANPIEFITRSMGTWTLVFLCLSLAMTPARVITGWTGFIHLRRKLGRRWSHLHRLIYAIAVLAILHYWWHKAGKSDYETVSIYLGVIVVLLLLRLPFIRQYIQIKK